MRSSCALFSPNLFSQKIFETQNRYSSKHFTGCNRSRSQRGNYSRPQVHSLENFKSLCWFRNLRFSFIHLQHQRFSRSRASYTHTKNRTHFNTEILGFILLGYRCHIGIITSAFISTSLAADLLLLVRWNCWQMQMAVKKMDVRYNV